MRATLAFLLLAGALGLTTACGDDDPVTVIDSPIVGIWSAVEVDGDSLPLTRDVTVGLVVCTVTVRAIAFSFVETGRYEGADDVWRQCEGDPEAANVSSMFRGTWRVRSDSLFLKPDFGQEEGAHFSISGSRLTLTSAAPAGGESVIVLERR